MSFTDKKLIEVTTADEPTSAVQAHGEAETSMKLDTPVNEKDMMEATTADEPASIVQALGEAEIPVKLEGPVDDQDMMETEASVVEEAPEQQVGVFGKISGCYGWFKTKLGLA